MLFAGTDTTSNVLVHALELLATNSDIQDRVRQELEDAQDYQGQDISYDRLSELPLLDAVCKETLRLYVSQFVMEHDYSFSNIRQIPSHRRNPASVSGLSYLNLYVITCSLRCDY